MHFRDFNTGEAGSDPNGAADALAAVTRVHTFFTAIRSALPGSVRLDVEPEVDMIESTDGKLVDSFAVAPPAQISGSGVTTYSAAAGAVVNWRTAGVRNGRKVRGRTFLVPIATGVYGADGNLTPAIRTTLQTAADALRDRTGTPDLCVYGRPTTKGATDGVVHVVISASVPSMSAILTSRRD